MRILFLSQVFWPDNVSTAQHLYDLAIEMVDHGHQVSVICSRFSYEDTSIKYSRWERHKNIQIKRLRNTKFGKHNIAGRLIDFLSFNLLLYIHLKKNSKDYDLILGMTSPPLVSYIGILFAKKHKIKFCYWTMDLQPELAIASGLIKEHSISAFFLKRMANYVIKKADLLIALDNYMKQYLIKRGALKDKIKCIPVWPVIDEKFIDKQKNPFRMKHGFGNKIVIMYSGNHAYVHHLDTLLKAARNLKDDERFIFVFIGEGVRKKDVTNFKNAYNLSNIVQLPYEHRNNIHNSLGAADLHVVILGNGQVGYTHPNKIYGAMFIGKPIIYIGPNPSHISDILNKLNGNIEVMHSDDITLTSKILRFASQPKEERKNIGEKNFQFANKEFSPLVLKEKMRLAITSMIE
jgi:colanic acid biosynthesis glycosyl transferase WcaI